MKKLTNVLKNKYFYTFKILFIFTCLLAFLFYLCLFAYKNFSITNSFKKSLAHFQFLNEKNIFSIDKIYLFSSAYAENSSVKQPIWNLATHQYTDIALYLNNHNLDSLSAENTLKSLSISDIKFLNKEVLGSPNLFYKNVYNFGKYEKINSNLISNKLDYSVVLDNISFDTPQIYANCSNPITLSYLNSNIKTNCIVDDTSLSFNGSLLKNCSIPISDISNSISFTITIVNNMDQTFSTNVFLDIPLKNDTTSIYDGSFTSVLEKESLYKFYRI